MLFLTASLPLHSQTRDDEECYKTGARLAIKVIHLERQNDSLNAALVKCKEADKPKPVGLVQRIKDGVPLLAGGFLLGAILTIVALK